MSENEYKTGVGVVAGTIILFLNLFSILCELFNTEIVAFVSLSDLVRDSSGFQTMVCISFILFAILKGNKSFGLMAIYLVDLVLANKFYSNARWEMIFTYFKAINKSTFVLVLLAGILLVYIFYVFLIKTKEKKDAEEKRKFSYNNMQQIDKSVEENLDNGNTTEKFNNDTIIIEKNNSNLLQIVCIFVIALGILDYIIYNLKPIKISRPAELEWLPDVLYYCTLICAAILVTLFCFSNLLFVKIIQNKNMDEPNKNENVIPGILAFGLDIFIFTCKDKFDKIGIPDKFLEILTGNWLTSIFAMLVVYMILHIAMTILFDLFSNRNNSNLTEYLNYTIGKVEKKMVIVACNIIDGCISLLDFIPDFFATIGLLLLGKRIDLIKDEENNEKDGKKSKGGADNEK